MTEYIYLLQTREFFNTNQNIYKIGRTSKENLTRFNQYPKGSKLLFQMICERSNDKEKELLNKFRKKYNEMKDIGNEYFEGDYNEMIDDIYKVLRRTTTEHENIFEDIENKERGLAIGFNYNLENLGLEFDSSKESSKSSFYTKTIHNKDKKYNDICNICMLDERKYDQIWNKNQMNCFHVMHSRCLRRWCYYKNEVNCPDCGKMEYEKNYYCGFCDNFGHYESDIYKCKKKIEYLKNMILNNNTDINYYFENNMELEKFKIIHGIEKYENIRDKMIINEAKLKLKKWFEETEKNDYMEIGDISFRSNRESGIFLDYPICKNEHFNSWENNWDEINTCLIEEDGEEYYTSSWDEYVPTYFECIDDFNVIPLAFIDMVLSHKGRPCYGIEIYHKIHVSSNKIKILKNAGVYSLMEIDALWILNQNSRPDNLIYKELI